MNQLVKTIFISMIFIWVELMITSCGVRNEFTIAPGHSAMSDSDEKTTTLTEPINQTHMDSTQTLLAASIDQTEIPDSSMNLAEDEYMEDIQSCIEPFSEFAYSGAIDNRTPLQQPVLPLAPWEEVIEFPQNLSNKETYYLALTRQYKGEVEIWIDNYIVDEIIIFEPERQEQRVISSKKNDYPGMTISPIFIQSDGTVWGQNYVYGENNEILYDPYPPLSRFNEETQRFEIPKDMFTISLYQEYMAYRADPLIFLDKNDVFWVFVQHDGLYQYDTHMGKTNKVLQTPDLDLYSGVMDQNGGIYFNRPTLGYPTKELSADEILFFNPLLRKLMPLTIPNNDWPAVLGLFVDPDGRLWTDISGYRDTDGEWYLLHENINEYFKKFNILQSWQVPSIQTQTSDGRFWVQRQYSYINEGTAWFDPETGEGCWFTSYTSRIVEDANHRLWFEADGKLYKYDLQP